MIKAWITILEWSDNMFVVSLQRSCVLPSHGSITSLSFLESSDIKWWQALNCVQESTHQWHHNHLFLVLIQIQELWSHSCFEFLNSVKVCMESASCCLAHKPVRNTSCNVASEHTAVMVWGNETSVNQEDVLCFKVNMTLAESTFTRTRGLILLS